MAEVNVKEEIFGAVRRNQTRKQKRKQRFIPIEPNPDNAYGFLPKRPMDFEAFERHINEIRKYECLLKVEFEAASRNEIYTKHGTRHANKPKNELKNTYAKKCPYDFNRVVLSKDPLDEEESDYINASYVDSILKPNAYIAAQGPNEYTITDFWRLIWEQHSFVIVMLTKVFDFIRVMCCQYWPMEEHKPEMYGPIEVTLLSEEQLADFVIRTMKIRKPGQKCKRKQKKIKLVPKDMAKEANKERLRMLMEDENEVQSSNDRFRESNQSKIFEKNSAECDEDVKSEKSSTQPSTRRSSTIKHHDQQNDRQNHHQSTKKPSFASAPILYDEIEYEEEFEEDDVRIIYQLHYNSWSSHTSPFPSSILQFRRRVRIYMNEVIKEEADRVGPTIVHCSDGCGRTGTYLCIDANLELSDDDGLFDVYGYTKRLKHSRRGLIENREQYKFVYETLYEAHVCGKTWFPVEELSQQIKTKSQKDSITGLNQYQVEYRQIQKMTRIPTIGECAGGHRVENREKNRDVSTVPPDNFRPYLTSFQSNENTDYINAVFVDGYTRSKEYIITEWPLKRTISDIWSLIYDHECNSVIILGNPMMPNLYPYFWPLEKFKKTKYGSVFSVEMVSSAHYPKIKTWIFKINKKVVSLTELMAGVKAEPKTTQFFQITCWPLDHKVPTSTNALVELMNMVERWRQRTNYGQVIVISYNGKSRAGVYCATNFAMEQVVQHGEVDIFNAVRTVRRHRPPLIENMV
ncbi:monocarboxylate transporter 12-like [Sarcoptes scabiei]|nr:monocarboxylate transporter 12-like [Sarcoptes scabiei]